MTKIAIITGATGGLGREFVNVMMKEDVDEIWAVARNETKLENLKKELGNKIIVIGKDLALKDSLLSIKERLLAEKPQIEYLINNAGVGKLGTYADFSPEELEATVGINCHAVIALCSLCIPYMHRGSRIVNMSSQASFQPNPYFTLYAATKAFVTSYSRGLHRELKGLGITVTAVCPGWVNTELLPKEWNGKKVEFTGIVEPRPVAEKAIRNAKQGKDMSVYGAYVKWMQLFSKLMPHSLIMSLWIKSIEKYN